MKPNHQQQAILNSIETDSRETLVDWIRTNAIDFAKYSESDCGLTPGSARAVAQTSLELLESAIDSLRRYDEAGKRPLGQRMSDPEKRSIAVVRRGELRPVVPNTDFGANKGTY